MSDRTPHLDDESALESQEGVAQSLAQLSEARPLTDGHEHDHHLALLPLDVHTHGQGPGQGSGQGHLHASHLHSHMHPLSHAHPLSHTHSHSHSHSHHHAHSHPHSHSLSHSLAGGGAGGHGLDHDPHLEEHVAAHQLEMLGAGAMSVADTGTPSRRRQLRCKFHDCQRQPSYGIENTKKALYCRSHALEGMVSIRKRRCKFDGCNKAPLFGHIGDGPKFCREHKQEGMVNARHKSCIEPGCSIRAAYGIPDGPPLHCATHRHDGEVDRVNRLCKEAGCFKHPSKGERGSKRALYCAEHAGNDMVAVNQNKRARRRPSSSLEVAGLGGVTMRGHEHADRIAIEVTGAEPSEYVLFASGHDFTHIGDDGDRGGSGLGHRDVLVKGSTTDI